MLLCLTGCTKMEDTSGENRTVFTIDPTRGSPFNGGEFEGWGSILLVGTDETSTVLAAYSEEEQKLVIVVVNVEETDLEVGFSLEGFRYDGGTAQAIRTSQDENWAELPENTVQKDMLRTTLAPYSVTTFVIDNVTIKQYNLFGKQFAKLEFDDSQFMSC